MSCSSRHLDPAPVPWPALKSRCHDDPEWETSVCDVMELGRSVWALWCGNGGHDLGASKAIQNGLSWVEVRVRVPIRPGTGDLSGAAWRCGSGGGGGETSGAERTRPRQGGLTGRRVRGAVLGWVLVLWLGWVAPRRDANRTERYASETVSWVAALPLRGRSIRPATFFFKRIRRVIIQKWLTTTEWTI